MAETAGSLLVGNALRQQGGSFIPNKENRCSVGANAGMKLNAKGVIMRVYQPDLKKYKTWKAPKAELVK